LRDGRAHGFPILRLIERDARVHRRTLAAMQFFIEETLDSSGRLRLSGEGMCGRYSRTTPGCLAAKAFEDRNARSELLHTSSALVGCQ